MNVLHTIHDFVPRHVAGSEIYAFELCRELAARHHVTVLAAEYDPSRAHGQVTWRVEHELPVVELVNNWECASFEDTYRSPRIGEQIAHVLDAVQPDVVHIHNLLNLTFDLPALARARGAAVVATLHDYTLVCPSGGQRIHRADRHLCEQIDVNRCARCFSESPFAAQMSFAAVSSRVPAPGFVHGVAREVGKRMPGLTGRVASIARQAVAPRATPQELEQRLAHVRTVFDQIDLFVAPSQCLAGEFERLGVDPARMQVSDYGFVPLVVTNDVRPSGPLRIGFAGTLVWHKGAHVLLDAVRRLPPHAYEVKLFGDLNVAPAYIAELRAHSAGLPVQFMGAFDRDRVAGVYAEIDVLVVPSLWFENSPLVIHEAFMARVPVVGARIGGIPELVRDNENGLLYEPTSAEDLAAILRTLIDDPARLESLRRRLPAVKPISHDARDWEARYAAVLDRLTERQPA